MSTHRVVVEVNGETQQRDVDSRRLLSDFLRHELHLRGTRVGCEHGVCGSCTVLMDGEPVRSCTTLAVQVDGASVETVEGLTGENAGELHPVQAAFSRCHGLQCGFCTSGILMSIKPAYDEGVSLDRDAIRELISGNICRCTGYQQIVDSVADAFDARDREVADE